MAKLLLILISSAFLGIISYGQYQIGHTTITFNDPNRSGGFGSGGGPGRQIQTEIYYPSTVSGDNVAAASGDFPVIVFGHGFFMTWDAYANIWQHYVPLGYILAFPRTEGSLSPSHDDFSKDLAIVVDKMQIEGSLSSSTFYQRVNSNSAIMGHSMGGGATILAAQNNSNIKTIVGFAPAETTPSAIAAASNVTVPALIYSGSSDGVTPPANHHEPIYSGLGSSCKTFISIIGGAHCYYANSNAACDFGESTSSPNIGISRAQQQATTFASLDLWLDYILRGNSASLGAFLGQLSSAQPSELISQSSCAAADVSNLNSTTKCLYPNPATNTLTLPFDVPTEFIILDAQGKCLMTDRKFGPLDVQWLERGLYYIFSGQGNYTFLKD